MNPNGTKHNLEEELNRANFILKKILGHIRSIDEHLKSVEQNLEKKEFISRDAFVRRNPNLIVCLPTSTSRNGCKYFKIQEILEKNSSEPSMIWIDDYEETIYTCKRIVRLVNTQFLKLSSNKIAIINLRLSQMIKPFEAEPTLMIGNRYILDDDDKLATLAFNLKQIGFQVVYDNSEFGGGPLVSILIKNLHPPKGSIIVELTLSHSAVEEISCVNEILSSVSSFWM